MIIGAHAKHIFTLPKDFSGAECVVFYGQNNVKKIEKTPTKSEVQGNTQLTVELDPDEVANFTPAKRVQVQVYARLNDKIYASNIMEIVLHNGLSRDPFESN